MGFKLHLFIIVSLAILISDAAQASNRSSLDEWLGTWVYDENTITITKNSDGTLHASGDASFCCIQISGEPGSNNDADYQTNYGSFAFDAKPEAGHLVSPFKPGIAPCAVDIAKKDDTLVVDEHHCGGLNVSFNGTYKRKQP